MCTCGTCMYMLAVCTHVQYAGARCQHQVSSDVALRLPSETGSHGTCRESFQPGWLAREFQGCICLHPSRVVELQATVSGNPSLGACVHTMPTFPTVPSAAPGSLYLENPIKSMRQPSPFKAQHWKDVPGAWEMAAQVRTLAAPTGDQNFIHNITGVHTTCSCNPRRSYAMF